MAELLSKRKPLRLKEYDYSKTGYYYVTICTKDKRRFLCSGVGAGLAPPEFALSQVGQIVQTELLCLPQRFPNVQIDKYVVMPNHLHAVIVMQAGGASPAPTQCPTLSAAIGAFKSLTTRQYNQLFGTADAKLWQRGYYDHIIRNDEDYRRI